jgi:NADH-quinone oxidoreductase subunit C/D
MEMSDGSEIVADLQNRFGNIHFQPVLDQIPTVWVPADSIHEVLTYLKSEISRPFRVLYDLSAIDERIRSNRAGQPAADFTVFYHLLSYDRKAEIRIKTALIGDHPTVDSITSIWPSANWYEREVWDMFGIIFKKHPDLRRILMPSEWKGHPLRKEHPARGTELPPYRLPENMDGNTLRFNPEKWGIPTTHGETDLVFLNMGPQHLGTHGPVRYVLELDGEEIINVFPEIGFHHRGDEKIAERQTWHTFLPYTNRVDYLGGTLNSLPYVLAVEKLAGVDVPDRAKVIRVMVSELCRCASHLVWYGTFALDTGAMSPVFYTFTDREYVFRIIEAICGGRMHPMWFRIGGVAQDLPQGWKELIEGFLDYFPCRLHEYDQIVMENRILRMRTEGIGRYTLDEAIDWGVTGPNLRACGLAWDLRKVRPYSGYDWFDFHVPTATAGDSYARAEVRVEEMRQSLRIIQQCLDHMPEGDYQSRATLATPPIKNYTLHDIETLITHFLNVSWGPVIPSGEASVSIESGKGNYSYYLISDGNTMPYRARIRTPSFAHVQTVPNLCRGYTIPDMIAILGSIDYIPSDIDR